MNDILHALSSVISQRYPSRYTPHSIVPIDSQQSFSGATIYRVETAFGSFALRGWPPGAFPGARIRGLHALLEFLETRGVTQVAAPVRTTAETTIWEFENRDWHLEPWKPGEPNFLVDPHPEKLKNTMHCLANWHQMAATWTPPREANEWFSSSAAGASSAIAERISRLNELSNTRMIELRTSVKNATPSPWTEPATLVLAHFEPLAELVHQELCRLSQVRFRLQPCLRDVWSDHVLFTGNEVTGLIDPTATRSDNVAVDLARLLGSLLGDDELRWHEALLTYHDRRPLNASERALVRVLDHSNVLLSAMTWLDRHFLGAAPIRHPAAALKRLTMYSDRICRLAKTATRIITP